MKKSLFVEIGTVLLTASIAVAQGNCITNTYSTFTVATAITIGPVSICTTNGTVTIREGVKMDEASREFWKILARTYPECFPPVTATNVVKLVTEGGPK